MSAGSPTFSLRRVAMLTLGSLWLVGCSSNNSQAPISSVGDNSSQTGSSRGSLLVTKPPTMTSTVPAHPQIQSVQQPVVQTQAAPTVSSEPVQTQNGRIVYNRQYGNIPKGSYAGGNTYSVKRGDTLFYIAWITGNDFRDLAQRNNISAPYNLEVGQTLHVVNSSGVPITGGNAITAADSREQQAIKPSVQNNSTAVASRTTITYSEDSGEDKTNTLSSGNGSLNRPVTAPAVSNTEPTVSSTSNSAPISSWRWPTEGKVIETFAATEGGNKGIDIAGSSGQAIVATAPGRVVYAGNALRGYGNLIIIKHNDDYLSAYAHNDKMLVREQEDIKAGQKIATMGSTGTSSTRLHFEIRYKGKSVNPLRYLPQR
ncbi:murein hydrolase activator NlpD [Citrobacter sp. JGM124]|uniref:murein hydrolase activator NlpD n=1 Tax=Citrobacter sp. JGM124 TaxID=2799789 RepID=UPI001BA925AB|nr:murein hydrolase activator NlpD [Citrobacter sp. JGM124]MBS0849500.1 murein hydrolase activator NlpD [Citrobacter sp. JGM124]